MIQQESFDIAGHLGQPTVLHAIKDQMTVVRGWTQLASQYSTEDWLQREAEIRKSLDRIDAATTRLIELVGRVSPSIQA